jgi:hypothetical protein
MATAHGKLTKITVATKDISPFTKNSQLERSASVHNTTGYAPTGDAELYAGGTRQGKFTCGGVYDNTALVGPRIVLLGQEGNILAIVRNVEGTGTGKPNDAFNAILEKYVESNPHDDMVTWSADFTVTGVITTTALP